MIKNIMVSIYNRYTFRIAAFALLFNFISLNAQPGIYSETDIIFQTLFIDAQLEKQKGNTDEQISLLKEVIKRDKSSHAAYFEMAKTYFSLEDLDAALKNIKKAIQFDAQNPYYLILQADIFEKGEQFSNAILTYDKLIALEPNNFEYYDRKSFNQMILGQADDAISTLKQWESIKGVNARVSQKLFDFYNSLGKRSEALTVLEQLVSKYPKNTNYLSKYANYLSFVGKKQESLDVFKKILKIDSQNEEAVIAINQATSQDNNGQSNLSGISKMIDNKNISLDNKIKQLIPFMTNMSSTGEDNIMLQNISMSLVKQYPNEAKAFAVRADVLFYSGSYKESEIAYDKAITLDDRQYLVWDQWMINLWELEQYKKLEKTSSNAIDYFPNQVQANLFNVIALYKNNKSKEAKKMLEEAVFISGENPKYLGMISIVSSWINMGQTNAEQLNTQLSNIKESELPNSIYFELLGDIYKHMSQGDKSKAYWKKAITLGANANRLNKKIGA